MTCKSCCLFLFSRIFTLDVSFTSMFIRHSNSDYDNHPNLILLFRERNNMINNNTTKRRLIFIIILWYVLILAFLLWVSHPSFLSFQTWFLLSFSPSLHPSSSFFVLLNNNLLETAPFRWAHSREGEVQINFRRIGLDVLRAHRILMRQEKLLYPMVLQRKTLSAKTRHPKQSNLLLLLCLTSFIALPSSVVVLLLISLTNPTTRFSQRNQFYQQDMTLRMMTLEKNL